MFITSPCPLCECWLSTLKEHGSLKNKHPIAFITEEPKWIGHLYRLSQTNPLPMSCGRHGAEAQGDANLGYRFLQTEIKWMCVLKENIDKKSISGTTKYLTPESWGWVLALLGRFLKPGEPSQGPFQLPGWTSGVQSSQTDLSPFLRECLLPCL